MYPADRKYSKDHEWILLSGAEGKVGITDYAQKQLEEHDVAELFAPMSGEVTAVNTALAEKPETVNTDPHGAWMVVLKLDDAAEAQELLDHQQYAGVAR